MDVLKYGFDIDLTRKELEKVQQKKKTKKLKRKPVIERHVYIP